MVVSYDIISHHHSRGVPLERTRKGPLKHSPHHTPAREDLRQKPVVPPHGDPLMGTYTTGYSSSGHSSYRPQTQKWGIPHLLPTWEKGGKRGKERGFLDTRNTKISLGEDPQTPPQLTRRGRPTVGGKDKRGGARGWRAGRTKSIDLKETN